MTLKELGEFGLIRTISGGCLMRPEEVVKAIGDDAAAFRVPADRVMLTTTDLLVERVHFLRDAISGFDLGHKALAVNLSDIAAMGGTAREAFVSIGIPEDCAIAYVEEIYRGMKALAGRFDVNILGGDTTGSKTDLVINVAVVGSIAENEILLRGAARPGDMICSTGCLGDSRAGLHLLLHGEAADTDDRRRLVHAHRLPEPHLNEGRFLASRGGVHACIDVSDGLSSDLAHVLEESGVGARIDAGRIPVSKHLRAFCHDFGFEPAAWALDGGEDYTLLCTVDPDRADALQRDFEAAFGRPLHRIGEITDKQGMELILPDGGVRPISSSGWDHFKPAVPGPEKG